MDELLPKIKESLEEILHFKIISIEQLKNKYGMNQQIYKLKTSDETFYFMKISQDNSLHEADGYKKLSAYLPLPKLKFTGIVLNKAIILYEYEEGVMMTDFFIEQIALNKADKFIKIEDHKNKLLYDMYLSTKGKINYDKYITSKTNDLFQRRLLGERFESYYGHQSELNSLLNKNIILNGKSKSKPIELINIIKKKYLKGNNIDDIDSVLGHGDAHHQNIIYDEVRNEIRFIDYEYTDNIPIKMELAKPYYIDLLGTLFFFFEDDLLQYFEVQISETQLDSPKLNIRVKSLPSARIELTKNKIEYFNSILNEAVDPLTLNDYLMMCHILSRNPNNYSLKAQYLFLGFIYAFNDFNPLDPNSLFEYFTL